MAIPTRTAYERYDCGGSAVRELVMQHLALVGHIAGRACSSLPPGVSEDDLIGAGALGLVEAAHRFDPSAGVKFTTFAYPRVRGAILDHLREHDPLGKSARERLNSVRRRMNEMRGRDGRRPTIDALAEETGLSEQAVLECLSYEKWESVGSLSQPGGGDGAQPNALAALIPADTASPLEELEWQERLERLSAAIERLPEREKSIIVMYYYEELRMAEMAEILQVNESRVSQLHTRAIYNLTRMLEGE
jgi:RNA polymerase sigma factor for flagellar operon FliA